MAGRNRRRVRRRPDTDRTRRASRSLTGRAAAVPPGIVRIAERGPQGRAAPPATRAAARAGPLARHAAGGRGDRRLRRCGARSSAASAVPAAPARRSSGSPAVFLSFPRAVRGAGRRSTGAGARRRRRLRAVVHPASRSRAAGEISLPADWNDHARPLRLVDPKMKPAEIYPISAGITSLPHPNPSPEGEGLYRR